MAGCEAHLLEMSGHVHVHELSSPASLQNRWTRNWRAIRYGCAEKVLLHFARRRPTFKANVFEGLRSLVLRQKSNLGLFRGFDRGGDTTEVHLYIWVCCVRTHYCCLLCGLRTIY